jgi:hypothetical protein
VNQDRFIAIVVTLALLAGAGVVAFAFLELAGVVH